MKSRTEDIPRYADMFAAMGTESRLRIMQLLLSAYPDGIVVGEIRGGAIERTVRPRPADCFPGH